MSRKRSIEAARKRADRRKDQNTQASQQTEDGRVVGRVVSIPRPGLTVGKPLVVSGTSMRRLASVGMMGASGSSTISGGSYGQFYSPEWSTDYLQLPHAPMDQWRWYRVFFETNPFVNAAVTLHTELPLSKLRLQKPKTQNKELGARAWRFCLKWADRIGLLHRLMEILHDYMLIGETFVFMEDSNPDPPREVTHQLTVVGNPDGSYREMWEERPDAVERLKEWRKKHYKGWTGIRVLPPESIQVFNYSLADRNIYQLMPSEDMQNLINLADKGDEEAIKILLTIPEEMVTALRNREGFNLPVDPDGPHIAHLSRKKSQYETRGRSILAPVMRTLVHQDKLRQAQAQITSRHMTPIRVVSGEGLDSRDVDALREQIDYALQDPDYSIIANKTIEWNEMGSEQRMLELSSEYDLIYRQLYAGLGVTETLLTGESSYSGDRINLEVINTRYMLIREVLQDFVHKHLFEPMCRKMGFVEIDEDGDEVVIYPRLSFTRLALRDNTETFNDLFNLYNKGSLGLSVILDLLNIDYDATEEEITKSLFTVNDNLFNECMRSIYSSAAEKILEGTDVVSRIAESMNLVYTKPAEEGRY